MAGSRELLRKAVVAHEDMRLELAEERKLRERAQRATREVEAAEKAAAQQVDRLQRREAESGSMVAELQKALGKFLSCPWKGLCLGDYDCTA
eukprot:SAG11_NODE_2410_length_3394_cov_2.519575_5_plen_92_part_00